MDVSNHKWKILITHANITKIALFLALACNLLSSLVIQKLSSMNLIVRHVQYTIIQISNITQLLDPTNQTLSVMPVQEQVRYFLWWVLCSSKSNVFLFFEGYTAWSTCLYWWPFSYYKWTCLECKHQFMDYACVWAKGVYINLLYGLWILISILIPHSKTKNKLRDDCVRIAAKSCYDRQKNERIVIC